MKLVVLSDLHVMVPGVAARDLGTLARLDAAIGRINHAYGDADLVVFAGDLVDYSTRDAAYGLLKDRLATLRPKHALTIGNHDCRASFAKVFGPDYLQDGFAQSAHDLGTARVLVLDSVKTGPSPEGFASFTEGALCEARLRWLQARLDEARGHPVVIVMHHPVLPLQIETDNQLLQSPAPFLEALAAHGDVRQVIAGHVHMTTTTLYRGIPFTTLSGGFSSTTEDFGRRTGKVRREGPAQMAVVLGTPEQVTVHFDTYMDCHALVKRG